MLIKRVVSKIVLAALISLGPLSRFPAAIVHPGFYTGRLNTGALTATFGTKASADTTPNADDVPVLVLRYFPDEDGDGRLDLSLTGVNYELEWISVRLDEVDARIIDTLERGSSYHGYKDSAATPSLNYFIIEKKEFIKPIPKLGGSGAQPPDHNQVLTGEGFDICDYVENLGVKEVWLWMYHTDETYPVESYQQGPHGGLGNGWMNLPLCSKTYTVYDYNFAVGSEPYAENKPVHNHMHHLERLFGWVDEDTFWNRFAAVTYQCCPWMPHWVGSERRCGNGHNPPNSEADYGYWYDTPAESDCEDWSPEGGTKKSVSCHTWGDYQGCDSCTDTHYDRACTESAYYIWWMQNVPGRENGLVYQGKKMRSWWEFFGDFDRAVGVGRGFLEDPPSSRLLFKFRLQGIDRWRENSLVNVVFKQGDSEEYQLNDTPVVSDQNGIYSGQIADIAPGTYDIYLTGRAHLRKRFADVTLEEGGNNQDWSGTSLPAGDTNNDNQVNQDDINQLTQDYLTANKPPSDFNLDGRVDMIDFGLLAENFLSAGD